MILYVRYLYLASVVPPRKRTPVDRVHEGVLPVEIRQAGTAEAPLALVAGYAGRKVPHRLLDGGLVAPYEHEGAPLTAAGLAAAAEGAHRDADGPDPFGTRQAPRGEPGRGEPGADGSKVRSTDEARRRAAIQAKVDRLVLVDGVVHRPAPEPVYVVAPTREGRRLVARPLAEANGQDTVGSHHILRADEVEFALSDRRAPGIAEGAGIEVLLPEALRYRGAEAELADAAGTVRDVLAKLIVEGTDATFRAYRGLRDGLAEFRASEQAGAAPEPDGLAELLREALDPAHGVDGYWTQRGAAALARLDARALSLDFGPNA